MNYSTRGQEFRPSPQEREAKKALDQLAGYPGMAAVKSQVEQIIQFHKVAKLRSAHGLKTENLNNHMVFTGNPGTGKTTAARLIGQAFTAMELIKTQLTKAPFVEIGHADVTSELFGRAEQNVTAKFNQAKGGVLFIDEAYAFIGEHNANEKLMATIVQLMENMRDEVIVIAAGYPKEMEDFLNFNPGLRSRFSNIVHFPDYTAKELVQIAQHMADAKDYKLDKEYQERLAGRMELERRAPKFGNARTVRNLIEQSIKMQSVRISRIPQPTKADLQWIKAEDLPNKHSNQQIENALVDLLGLSEKMRISEVV
jgi:stage V sporulation protein K